LSLLHRRSLWRHAVIAVASAAALVAAPIAAMAAQAYTINVTATGGTLTGASAIDGSGTAVAGTGSGGAFAISETTPGPFTIIGSGTTASGSTAEAVYFGETVTSGTYSDNLTLALPAVMPTEVTAPGSIALTAGTMQTVAISVYNATYGAVGDGALVALSPSNGLTLTASGAHEAQVGPSVYASTVSGTVYATLSATTNGTYSLNVGSPPGSLLTGGSLPVYVTSGNGGGGGCTTCGGGTPGGSGGTVTVDGVSGTVILSVTFDAATAQTLTSSDGAVTLDIPAGAIAASGTVTLQIVEFGSDSTKTLLKSSTLAAYEHSLGLSFDFSASVNGSAVHTFVKPISALYSLNAAATQPMDSGKVDLMRINADGSLTFTGGKWNGSQVKVSMGGFTPYTLMEVNRTFPDIQQHWAQSDIELMASKFVTQGYPDGNFYPQASVTRAQFTALLLRMVNIPVDSSATTTFGDVASGSWYYGTVATAAAKGIVQGYSSTSFGPNDLITREQLVTMFVRAMELEGWASSSLGASGQTTMAATFADAGQVDSWAQADMGVAVADGLIEGRTPTTIVPLGVTTRAEATTWVARMFTKFA